MELNILRKKYREKANRAKRELLKEKKQYGYISDGSGRRYRIGVYYLISGDTQKALEYYTWFDQEFDDDIGEPIFSLFWALTHHRSGNFEEAAIQLQKVMLQNIYLLPHILGEPIEKQHIWHSSNCADPDYIWDVEEFFEFLTEEETMWIKQSFFNERFSYLRNIYIKTHAELLHEKDFVKRGVIINEFNQAINL